jgi:hypothetical protein
MQIPPAVMSLIFNASDRSENTSRRHRLLDTLLSSQDVRLACLLHGGRSSASGIARRASYLQPPRGARCAPRVIVPREYQGRSDMKPPEQVSATSQPST